MINSKLRNTFFPCTPELILLTSCLTALMNQGVHAQNGLTRITADSDWYAQGAAAVDNASRRAYNNRPGAAKNIILFVGDGMGVSTVTAARIHAGQQQGLQGEEYQLSFEKFPWTGLSKTYNTNQQTSDSAGTMTAMMTGIKTRAGVISVDEKSRRGDCSSYLSEGNDLITVLELAEIAGKATGIVSTARLTHATPAATYAKAPERNWESSENLSNEERDMGCRDIAQQLIDFESNLEAWVNRGNDHPNIDGIDVAFGGGRRAFFGEDPASLAGFAENPGEGRRNDGRNLITEWQNSHGLYVMDQAGFDAISASESRNVLGLFDPSHLHYEADRANDSAGEPSLTEMTLKAIDLLGNDDDGFFLMVEAGRIDHAHHAGNAFNALNDAVELSRAVDAAVNAVDTNETLIIVTADHSHTLTFSGYPTRGNPILGKVITNDSAGNPQSTPLLATDGLPYTTLGYANGAGFIDNGGETDADKRGGAPAPGRHDLSAVDTTRPGFHQEALVPTGGETHGGEDVAIYAIGPGAHLLSGVIEQNVIFHVMNFAGDLENSAVEALE